MKAIEERADILYKNIHEDYITNISRNDLSDALKEAYIKGATTQKQIVCEAFCKVCQTKKCGGKGTKYCLWLTRFKKTMEE